MEVSLAGIAIPGASETERSQAQSYSERARSFLVGLILNRLVEIKGHGLDRFDRVLGVIYLNGRNINLEMVRAGMAEAYRGTPPVSLDLEPYRRVEEEARKEERGMWALGER